MGISIIITSWNEGERLQPTIDSVFDNTKGDVEIVLVDDGSDDGSCNIVNPRINVIRHDRRMGIVHSRREGSDAAQYECVAFLDGHQALSPECLNKCADLALERQAIVWPCVRGMHNKG